MKTYALVLAAGKGTRMKSEIPKCAYPILRKPIIEYIIEKFEKSGIIDEVVVVVGYKKEVFEEILDSRVTFCEQIEQKGTADAVNSARGYLIDKPGVTLIVPGDMPLMTIKLTNKIIKSHIEMGNDLTVVSTVVENPKGYGRIVRNKFNVIQKIVEDRDCNEYQKQIHEINSGVYVVNNEILFSALDRVKTDNIKGEYYLTDIVELLNQERKIGVFTIRDSWQAMGVNDLYQVSQAEKYLRELINKDHMVNGVNIINPDTVTLGHDVKIEPSATILPNSTITGKSIIKAHTIIGPNTEVHNSIIHEGAHIKHSLIYDSEVQEETTIGPFAHLRNHAVIGPRNRIGNFVEVKNSSTGADTKASHLSYIGDAKVGSRVNFGCGSITVNFDGVNKHQTEIGDDVFIGCNVNMVAPLKISDNVFVAGGSTVTKDIPKGSLTIARSKQIDKTNYYSHYIKPKPVDDKVE